MSLSQIAQRVDIRLMCLINYNEQNNEKRI